MVVFSLTESKHLGHIHQQAAGFQAGGFLIVGGQRQSGTGTGKPRLRRPLPKHRIGKMVPQLPLHRLQSFQIGRAVSIQHPHVSHQRLMGLLQLCDGFQPLPGHGKQVITHPFQQKGPGKRISLWRFGYEITVHI